MPVYSTRWSFIGQTDSRIARRKSSTTICSGGKLERPRGAQLPQPQYLRRQQRKERNGKANEACPKGAEEADQAEEANESNEGKDEKPGTNPDGDCRHNHSTKNLGLPGMDMPRGRVQLAYAPETWTPSASLQLKVSGTQRCQITISKWGPRQSPRHCQATLHGLHRRTSGTTRQIFVAQPPRRRSAFERSEGKLAAEEALLKDSNEQRDRAEAEAKNIEAKRKIAEAERQPGAFTPRDLCTGIF